ncbi:kalirin-like isoform X4 [Xenia sp. Carnegie-2017]|uniref:kalirin-like isoform X4 n=1 Tax=Xenia sp. Carnegie-2017 TaxID=2897299 RepID=UPI001F03776C|nr:kalirin-like isoform X4 [Xenia sp. Carnegie-2017]
MMSRSERWSSASSDSDASFVLFGGEHRGELQGSNAIHDILKERIAYLSGGKDKRGGPVITIPSREATSEVKNEDFKRLLHYLSGLPSDNAREQGFSIVLDMRGSTWLSIKPILKSMQESFPLKIHSVYIIKPEGFWERHKASSGSGKFNFEVTFSSLEGLTKYIEPCNLTSEFGGTLSYDHDQWVIMQMSLEKFNFEAMTLLTKLDEIHEGLMHQDYADDLVALREQVKYHQHIRKWIIKAPIDTLEEEGSRLLEWINENKLTQEDGASEDWKATSARVKNILENLNGERDKLKDSWHIRKHRLDQCIQYHLFQLDAKKMRKWIKDSQDDLLTNFIDVGMDEKSSTELQEEHGHIQTSFREISENIKKILEGADKLLHSGHYEADQIESIAVSLEQEWKQFSMDISERGNLLSCSVGFHKKSEEFLRRVASWEERLNDNSYSNINDIDQLSQLLIQSGNLKKDIDTSYEAVSAESKQLLEALQKPLLPGDDRDTPEFSEAASHVMELFLNVHEHHRQLGILWEAKQSGLRELIHMSTLEQDINQVIKWIDEHGEPFLDKHTDVGMTTEKAEALLKRHEEFEAIAKNTYTNANQIRDAIKQLQDSGECRADEIRRRTQYFDRRVQNFVRRVDERRQILELAVSFYSCSKNIHNDVERVKAQLEIEELSDDPDDIAKVLLKLRHECERSLDNINKNINDGKSIVQHMKANAQDGKNESRDRLQEIIKDLEGKKNVLEMAWMRRREQMELWQQLWEFERDGENVKNHLENCEADLEKGGLADDLNGAKLMLNSFQEQLKAIDTLSLRTFCKGEELIDLLRHSDVELRVRNPSTPETIEAHQHIQNLLEFLHNQRRLFLEFAEARKKKLEQRLALKQLEADTKQAIGCIRNGENMLLSNIIPGFSLAEAKDSLTEYEQFKTAMEKTSQRVASIRSRADELIKQKHPRPEQLMKCSDLVMTRWQQLMKKANEKQQVVMSSYNFFKTSEKVSSLLQKVLKEYKIGDDPCSQYADLELRDRSRVITSLLEKHAREREEIAKGHEAVYGFADAFLKYVSPSAENGGIVTVCTPTDANKEKMEQQVKEISELIRGQKKFALDLWNVKNTILGQCKEFLDFETNAKQALEWIHDQGEFYLSSNAAIPENEEEAKQRYEEHLKFTQMSVEIREKVKSLLQEADELFKRSCFHSDGIMQWATAVDKRFKDFTSRMTKYLNQLESKLGFPITKYSENDEEMPDVSVLSQAQQNPAIREKTLNLRELSKDSGIHELMEEEKRKSARRKEFIMNELLHTERTYVADLKCIIQSYMDVMDGNPSVPPGLVGKEDVIFGNIKQIYEFHQSVFLNALEKYETNPEDVGECFAEKAEEFKMYVSYCKNKTLSNNLLIEHGGTFFSDLQASYNHGLSIAAYLIKPVQRITKYQLLLKDLLTCCEGSETSLQAGLEVMLGVPRQANDEMSIGLIRGFDEHLHLLGKILLQDVFFLWDAKLLRRKGKERHLFLFEQALLVTKEDKDVDGKVIYVYKYKLRCSEIGITEHIAEDGCKFALWTGLPPNCDVKKIVKANTLDVKQNWVKQLRNLQQQYQFGVLRSKTMSFSSKSPWKNPDRESGVVDDDRVSWDFECGDKTSDEVSGTDVSYFCIENFTKVAEDEVSLKKGQFVEVLESPANCRRWRIRFVNTESEPQVVEGWIPSDVLKRQDTLVRRNSDGSMCSSEDSNSLSSCNDLSPAASLYNSTGLVNGATSPPLRRRAKSTGQFGTLRMKPWRRDSMNRSKKVLQTSPIPRNTRISGGGSKKLQALLGASENDIDLLIKTNSLSASSDHLKKTGSFDEDISLIEERHEELLAENGSTEIIPEEARAGNDGTLSKESAQTKEISVGEGLNASSESLLNEDVECNGFHGDEEDGHPDDQTPEDKEAVALKKRMYVIKELIQTEQDYVKDLQAVVEGYIPEMSKEDVPDELKGKEREIFGNLRQIFEWHKSFFSKELEKCEDAPEKIANVFLKASKRLEMYIHYCQKKPKSEGLVREFEDLYFNELRNRLGHRLALSDYLIKPVQRIMKYQLLLKDILKYTERANLESTNLKNALNIMQVIPKKANDMMNVGMIEGYSGNIHAQGSLILQDILQVTDYKAKTKPAKRRVFVFEQMIIFTEPFERKTDWTVFIYRHSIKTNFMGITENYADDPCKFALWTHTSQNEIYVLKAETPKDKIKWIKTLRQLLEHLKQFANEKDDDRYNDLVNELNDFADEALVNPIEYQGGNADPHGINSVTTSLGQATLSAVTHDNSRNNVEASPEVVRRRLNKTLSAPSSNQVKHFSLIPLHTAQNLEELTGVFSDGRGKNKYIAIADYKAKSKDQITVKKDDIVYVVSSKKHDKKWLYGHVAGSELYGLVPIRVLHKETDNNRINEDDTFQNGPDKVKLVRKHSFPSSALRRVTQKKSKTDFSHISTQLRDSIEKFNQDFPACSDNLPNGDAKGNPRFNQELRDAVINRPNTLRLSCEVIPDTNYTFQWQKDSKTITASERVKIMNAVHHNTLEITTTDFEDSGVYTCTAINDHGQVTTSCIAQIRDKPSSPSKPTVTEITSSSVIVKWNPPDSDGNSAITAYTVECKETGVSQWQAPVPFVSTTSTVVDDLTPGSVYQFRVSANNVVGISKPSPPTEPVTLDVGNEKGAL